MDSSDITNQEETADRDNYNTDFNKNGSLQECVGETNTNDPQTVSSKLNVEEEVPTNHYRTELEGPKVLQKGHDVKLIRKNNWVSEQGSNSDISQEDTSGSRIRESDSNEMELLQEIAVGSIHETQAVLQCHDNNVPVSEWNHENEAASKFLVENEAVSEFCVKNEVVSVCHDGIESLSQYLDETEVASGIDISPEASIILSSRCLGSSSSLTRRRPVISQLPDNVVSEANRTDGEDRRSPVVSHTKRRKIFNIVKHVVSIVLIVLDVIFDWIEYDEMNSKGTSEIVAERQVNNIKVTLKCEGTGETIQSAYMTFTIIGTILSIGQTCYIVYKIVHEMKNTLKEQRLVYEYIETLVSLIIKIFQLLLIMGFSFVCTLYCSIDGTKIFLAVNISFSFGRVSWRWFTSCECCTRYPEPPPERRQSARKPIGRLFLDKCDCFSEINSKGCFCFLLVIMFPLYLPFLPFIGIYLLLKGCSCPCDACSKQAQASEVERRKFKCERSFKCCILRCFPSRFEEPHTDACDCTCKTCLACEQSFKCFLCRCFPSHLPHKVDNVFECLCGHCLTCEQNCRCCILRCFPSYQQPPVDDFCTCKCSDCMACEIPCKCFTFRCCPTRLSSPRTDIWTCSCRECLAFTLPCKCFTFRCFPQYLNDPHPDICTCLCSQCLSCALPCPCFDCYCFPEHQGESNWFTCKCGKCLACEKFCLCCVFRICPSELDPPRNEIFQCLCTCCRQQAVFPQPSPPTPPPIHQLPVQSDPFPLIQLQPLPRLPTPHTVHQPNLNPFVIQQQPLPSILPTHQQPAPPRLPTLTPMYSCKKCLECLSKWKKFFMIIFLLLLILLYLFYLCMIAIELQYAFECEINETVLETTRITFIMNFVLLF